VASSLPQLRSYRASDFETLYRIDQVCFPEGIAYGRFEMKVYLRAEGSYCLLAESGGNVAGFILAELAPDEGHIITLDVAEAHRRSGVGSLLLNTAENNLAAEGVRTVLLETAVNNHAAVNFWSRHGYIKEGILKRYYLNRIDGYEMRKKLSVGE